MQINRQGRPRRKTVRTINAATAAEAVGPIVPGMEVLGLSKGQFSLVELLEHLLDTTGPADLVVSTWTAANADLAHTHGLVRDGRILSARWLVDFSFPARQPAYCKMLRERFGDGAIRATANHAKFLLVQNAQWAIVVRTSMNLNLNRRLEYYEISDDPELAAWFRQVTDDAFAEGSGVSSIGEAVERAGEAKRSIQTLGGAVSRRHAEMSYGREQQGIRYD